VTHVFLAQREHREFLPAESIGAEEDGVTERMPDRVAIET
jgi:hypothetical protein